MIIARPIAEHVGLLLTITNQEIVLLIIHFKSKCTVLNFAFIIETSDDDCDWKDKYENWSDSCFLMKIINKTIF